MFVSRLSAWLRDHRLVSRASHKSREHVSRGLTLAGDLQISAGVLQIDGCVMGDVVAKSSVVRIGPSGSVVGTVFADAIHLAGQVRGRMQAAQEIACASSADFDGHMLATALSIDMGARISGTMAIHGDSLISEQTAVKVKITPKLVSA